MIIEICIVVMVVAWIFGYLCVRRAFGIFLLWTVLCISGSAAVLLYDARHPSGDLIAEFFIYSVAVLCLIAIGAGPFFALLFGLRSEQDPDFPAKRAREAYRSLSPTDKARVHQAASGLLSLAAGHMADRMERSGRSNAARAFARISDQL